MNTQHYPPLIAHVVHALRMGGLENGLVNLINRTPAERYRHAVICLTDYDSFAKRITRKDTTLFALNKREGKNPSLYLRLWQVLRQLRPDIVHTRNMAALEAQVPAVLVGAHGRIHGEHGRDVFDLDGENSRYRWIRKLSRPLIHQFVPVSRDLECYLRDCIGVPARRISRISNGVDIEKFHPSMNGRSRLPIPCMKRETIVVGSVIRMEAVKDPMNLVHAFLLVRDRCPDWRHRLKLVMVGDGSLRERAVAALRSARAEDEVWLPGARHDIAEILRGLDVFVLPSLAEGVSNTVLEAMATGLPVIATRVGGNEDLVLEGRTGILVPRSDPRALADAISEYLQSKNIRGTFGHAARVRVEEEFSLDRMVHRYLDVYDSVLGEKGRRATTTSQRHSERK